MLFHIQEQQIVLVDVCEDSWQMDIDLLQNWLENNTTTKFVNEKPVTTEIDFRKKNWCNHASICFRGIYRY